MVISCSVIFCINSSQFVSTISKNTSLLNTPLVYVIILGTCTSSIKAECFTHHFAIHQIPLLFISEISVIHIFWVYHPARFVNMYHIVCMNFNF